MLEVGLKVAHLELFLTIEVVVRSSVVYHC